MPVAYLLVEMHITDPERYKAYMDKRTPLFKGR